MADRPAQLGTKSFVGLLWIIYDSSQHQSTSLCFWVFQQSPGEFQRQCAIDQDLSRSTIEPKPSLNTPKSAFFAGHILPGNVNVPCSSFPHLNSAVLYINVHNQYDRFLSEKSCQQHLCARAKPTVTLLNEVQRTKNNEALPQVPWINHAEVPVLIQKSDNIGFFCPELRSI